MIDPNVVVKRVSMWLNVHIRIHLQIFKRLFSRYFSVTLGERAGDRFESGRPQFKIVRRIRGHVLIEGEDS